MTWKGVNYTTAQINAAKQTEGYIGWTDASNELADVVMVWANSLSEEDHAKMLEVRDREREARDKFVEEVGANMAEYLTYRFARENLETAEI